MTFTSAANTGPTEMDLILAIVQEQLIREGKLLPTVSDFSGQVIEGIKQIEIPRYSTEFGDPQDQNPDGVTPVSSQTVDFVVDTLALDKWKTLSYEIPDRVSRQSRLPLEAELAASAGRSFAKYMDDEIIVSLRAASAAAPDHRIQLDNTGTEISLDNIANARELLNKADVSESDRFLIVSPAQERAMLNIANFIRANEYGSRDALLNGEIGRVFGFRVMVHNGLADAEAIAYQREAVGYAMQKSMSFETRRSDLKLQKTEYAFSAGWGTVTLEAGVKQVLLNATGA